MEVLLFEVREVYMWVLVESIQKGVFIRTFICKHLKVKILIQVLVRKRLHWLDCFLEQSFFLCEILFAA